MAWKIEKSWKKSRDTKNNLKLGKKYSIEMRKSFESIVRIEMESAR